MLLHWSPLGHNACLHGLQLLLPLRLLLVTFIGQTLKEARGTRSQVKQCMRVNLQDIQLGREQRERITVMRCWLLLEINQDGPLQDSDGDNLAMELGRDSSVRDSQTLQCLLGTQNSGQNKVTSGRTLEVGKGDQKKVRKGPVTKREASKEGCPSQK